MLMKGPRIREKQLNLSAQAEPKPLMVYKRINALNGNVTLSQNWNGTGNPKNLHYKQTSDEIHPGPPYNSGGPFASIKVLAPIRDVRGRGSWRAGPFFNEFYTLEGGFAYPNLSHDPITYGQMANFGFQPGQDNSIFPNLSPWGPKAYNSLRPRLEKAGLSVFLAEARDIPRMLRTTAKAFHDSWMALGGNTVSTGMLKELPFSSTQAKHLFGPKNVSDNFLNQQFGWAPFVSDIIKLQDAFVKSQIYLDQLTKDNNQWVRRTRTMANTEESIKIGTYSGLGCEPVRTEMSDFMDFGGGGHWDLHKEETSVVWGTGSFKYYRPELDISLDSYDSRLSSINRYCLLYGLRVNPSVIYKATPWTWLIDWFSNVGSQVDLANDIANDSIVSKYMYVMQTKVTHLRSYHYVPWFNGRSVLSWDRFIETKQRQPASTSFGFDLSPDALSLRQIAILGALGLTRT